MINPTTVLPSEEWWHRNLANIISVCNVGVALCSIGHGLAGRYEEAAWTMILTTLLDELDGGVARTMNTVSPLGARMDDVADFLSFVPGMASMLTPDTEPWHWLLSAWLLVVFYLRTGGNKVKCNGYYNGLPTNYMSGLAVPVLLLTGSAKLYGFGVLGASFMGLPLGRLWYTHPKLLESQSWKKALFVLLLTLVAVRTGAIVAFLFFVSYAFVPGLYLTPQKTKLSTRDSPEAHARAD